MIPNYSELKNVNIFINGVLNARGDAEAQAKKICEISQIMTIPFYNGISPDLNGVLTVPLNPSVMAQKTYLSSDLTNLVTDIIEKSHSDVNLIAHSQGSHIVEKTMKALKQRPDICRRINVVFLGAISNLNSDSGTPRSYSDFKDRWDVFSNFGRLVRIQWTAKPTLVTNRDWLSGRHSCNGYLENATVQRRLTVISKKTI